jgi:hypothetical protein
MEASRTTAIQAIGKQHVRWTIRTPAGARTPGRSPW